MAWLLHTPTFLFFALLSPVVALGTWLSDRWSGRRSGRKDAAAHALDAPRCAEPPGRRGARRRPGRRGGAPRPGHADRRGPTAVPPAVEPEPGGRRRADRPARDRSREHRRHADRARRRPRARRPRRTSRRSSTSGVGGGLAVVGPRERTVGVLHGVLAQLAALHPPGRGRPPPAARRRPPRRLGVGPVAAAPRRRRGARPPSRPERGSGSGGRRGAALLADQRHRPAPGRRGTTGTGRRRAPRLARRRGGPTAGRAAHGRPPGGPRTPVSSTLAAADSVEDLPVTVDAVLRLTGETGDLGVLSRQAAADQGAVVVDRLPRSAAAQFARDLAGARAPSPPDARCPVGSGCSTCPPQGSGSAKTATAHGFVVAIAGPSRGHAGPDRGGPRRDRSLPAGPARPRRRDHRLGQVRAAADPDRRAGPAATRRTGARSCSSTTRAAPPSPRRPRCRTPSGWSPTSTARPPPAPCAPSAPS